MATTTPISHRPVTFVENASQPVANPLLPSLSKPNLLPEPSTALTSNMQRPKIPSATPRKHMHGSVRRPTCTHLSMVRLYGAYTCQFCGRSPSLGWLYACREEDDDAHERRGSVEEAESLPSVSDDSDYFGVQALVAESLSMGGSVIRGIKDGHYSYDQIEKLIRQKEGLITAIWKVQNRIDEGPACTPAASYSSTSATAAASPAQSVITQAGSGPIGSDNPTIVNGSISPASSSSSNEILLPKTYSGPSKREEVSVVNRPPGCGFQACHNCRPYVYERLYISFESAFNDEHPVIIDTNQLPGELPVFDAGIVRNLGLREAPPPISTRRWEQIHISRHDYYPENDDLSSEDEDWTPTSDESEMDDDPCPKCPEVGACMSCGRGFERQYSMHGETTTLQHSGNTYGPTAYYQHDLHRVDGTNNLSLPAPRPRMPTSLPSSSTLSLPNTKTGSTLTPPSPSLSTETKTKQPRKARSVCGISGYYRRGPFLRPYGHYPSRGRMPSSTSCVAGAAGDAVEVEGGVALTEEAVENFVPDLFA